MRLKLMAIAVAGAFAAYSHRTGLVLGAVALELEKDAWTKLPKDVQALYVEKEGKYKLDGVEPPEDTKGLKSALEKEREAKKTAEKAMRDLAAQWEGLDAKQIRDMLEKLGGDEEAQLLKAGKVDEVVGKRMTKAQAAHEKALQAAQAKTAAADARANKYATQVLDNHVRAAATKAGLHANAIEDALFRARTIFKLNEEGDAVQLDAEGKPVLGKDGKTNFTPSEWLDGMKESAPHWFPASGTGGGAGGGNKNLGGKVIKRSAFEALSPAERATQMKDGVKVTD